jgi:hypothetical protein
MILYFCLLIAIFVVVALFYELCKVCVVHYTITINANPSHLLSSGEDILQTLVI